MAHASSDHPGGSIPRNPRVRLRLVTSPAEVDYLPADASMLVARPMSHAARLRWLAAGVVGTVAVLWYALWVLFTENDGTLWVWNTVWVLVMCAALISLWISFISSWRGSLLKREFSDMYPAFLAQAQAIHGTVAERDVTAYNGRVTRLTATVDYTPPGQPPARLIARMTGNARSTVLQSDIPQAGDAVMAWIGPGNDPWVIVQFNKEWATARLPQRQAKAGAEEPEESRFVSELAELTQMLHRGDLTPEEYEDAKGRLLNE
ncbi:SHOCT domain-containing protein [Klugiella xanthotipulae]|uniref:SHOCT domain-containing protein n=1 Tax=Klugiella xanthotipulae TaxID=244735 RepID=UPI0011534A51|nr:SHOCT domain-containing protein [Klugiella xanthotipulae]